MLMQEFSRKYNNPNDTNKSFHIRRMNDFDIYIDKGVLIESVKGTVPTDGLVTVEEQAEIYVSCKGAVVLVWRRIVNQPRVNGDVRRIFESEDALAIAIAQTAAVATCTEEKLLRDKVREFVKDKRILKDLCIKHQLYDYVAEMV